MRIDLHIDHLVLQGFPESDGRAIGAALRERLGELLVNNPPQWSDAARIDAGEFMPGPSAEHSGSSIATSVYKGLSRGGHP